MPFPPRTQGPPQRPSAYKVEKGGEGPLAKMYGKKRKGKP